jgi:aspartate/methionine/tyrosine aminotransferase
MSPTLRISALAGELRAAGEDILDFSAGQPDFPTPQEVKDAGKRAIDDNRTGYTANQGLAELREAIAANLKEGRGLEYGTDEILVSTGAKASLYFAAMAMFDPGDEVIVPRPYWVSYPEQLRLAGAVPVFVDCHEANGFKLDAADLERTISSRTKAVLLNYPSNPTGASYGREQLEPLAEVCTRHGIWIVADEIYSRLLFDGRRFVSVAEISPEVRARCLIIDGMSKTYSMTGWRIGYTAGPREVIAAMARVQSHSTSNATSISQWASVCALQMPGDEIERRTAEFQERRDVIVAGLRDLPGVSCVLPEGSFYAFPNVSGCFGGSLTGADALAGYLLERAKVAVVPGEGFGAPEHLRVSYAVDLERIREGLGRMAEALAALPAGGY